MSAHGKKRGILLTAAFGAFALGGIALFACQPSPPPPPVPSPSPALPPLANVAPEIPPHYALRISSVEGAVEVKRIGGDREMVVEGTLIEADDTLRAREGRAHLVGMGGEGYDIQLEPGSTLDLKGITHQSAKVRLGVGLVRTKVRAGSELSVEAKGSDALATSRGGAFSMSNDGAGVVAVATTEGEAELSAAGSVVTLRQGQRSFVRGGAPEKPASIPTSIFLKIDWPGELPLRSRKYTLRGRTDPGATVTVGDQTMTAGADGRFSRAIVLREGTNTVRAVGVDLLSRRKEEKRQLIVDSSKPKPPPPPQALEIPSERLWGPARD